MVTTSIVLALLAALALTAALGKRLPVPLPLLLIIVGALLAFIPGMRTVEIDPGVFFLLFIPPLLFADGWLIPKRELLRVLRSVLLLAFGLVILTVIGVGLFIHWLIPSLPLAAAFALGAIVSPTDAVATNAMTGNSGMPSRVRHILDGESLINDASGLVAFRFAIAALATGTFSWLDAAGTLLLVSIGGAAIGFAIAWLIGWIRLGLRTHCADDPNVQTVLSLLTPFCAYLAAEHLHVSGILAIVAAGLYAGWNDFKVLDAPTRQHAWEVWNMVLFAFNGVVFLLLGISLVHALSLLGVANLRTYAMYALILWAALTLLRLVWVYPGAYMPHLLSKRIRKREGAHDPRDVFLVGWAGLRGSVTMAAALSIPATLASGDAFPARHLIVFLAATTIVLTLVLNGLTLPLLVRAFAVKHADGLERERRAAEIAIAHAGSIALEREMSRLARPEERTHADDLLARYRRRIERHTANTERGLALADGESTLRRLTLVGITAERQELYALRDAGTINDETLRDLEARLDTAEIYVSRAARSVH